MPNPLYSGHNIHPAFQLRYSWTGWPASGSEPFPDQPPCNLLDDTKAHWEEDGLRLLEYRWTATQIQMTFSATPHISPLRCVPRIKGRLQHALRQAAVPQKFSRKVALRTIGSTTRETVERYVKEQVNNEAFADVRFADRLRSHHHQDPDVDLADPTTTASGRYWYNLHLVLVTSERFRIGEEDSLRKLAAGCAAIARKKGYAVSELSIMPDHLHATLRGDIEQTPHEIALAFQNNLAYCLGQVRIWMDSYYVGSFGEYDMKAVRSRLDQG